MSAASSANIDLTAKVEQYLAERLRLGFKPCSSDLAVRHFARFMAGEGWDSALTVDVMVQWGARSSSGTSWTARPMSTPQRADW